MLKSVFLIGSLVAIAFGQSCDPTKVTAPCDASLPCATGSTCDLTLGSCCLNADVVTTTVPTIDVTATGTLSTTRITGGVTVTSRTVTSSTGCIDRVNPATGTSDCASLSKNLRILWKFVIIIIDDQIFKLYCCNRK
ncbi:hypothetical protein L3Y34_015057 [Caenorhabditis briggsae]|uniref:Uncharacterized protein n=1 Tax=Caenorhabditis briggsae TaxID=6238 RepID=A0AAE9IYE5_CAEBR|nr:hypothetical protein L3Y34_015057 [Caenorhabditis briggsae]